MKYDPAPPHNMGLPETASPAVLARSVRMMAGVSKNRKEVGARVGAKLKLV